MYDYTALENFWKRYNKVLLDKVAKEKEKSVLLAENQKLRFLLKEYLDGISVSDEVMSKANPLFIVNQRTNAPLVNSLLYSILSIDYIAVHMVHVTCNHH